jgi:cation transport ATPase
MRGITMARLRLPAASLALMLLLPAIARAELRRVDLKIFGMDCATCAHGLRVGFRKLDGVESVEVSLERAAAEIRLRPANRVTLPQLRQIVKNNGFNAREAAVTVVGTLVDRGGKPALRLAGTDTTWLLTSAPASNATYQDAAARLKAQPSALVEATGIVAPPRSPDQPEELAIQTLKAVAK